MAPAAGPPLLPLLLGAAGLLATGAGLYLLLRRQGTRPAGAEPAAAPEGEPPPAEVEPDLAEEERRRLAELWRRHARRIK